MTYKTNETSEKIVGCLCWIIVVICIIGLLVLMFFVIGTPFYWLDNISCNKTAEKLNYKGEYSFFTGCVMTDKQGHKFLLNQNRRIEVQNDDN